MKKRFVSLLCACLAGAFLGTAWGEAPTAKIPVAASILPLADFCQRIGGPRVAVQVLIPPGASPHAFEPSPRAVGQAMQARIFVYVGAGLDPWAERLLRSRETKGLAVVEAVQGLPLLTNMAHHVHDQEKAKGAGGQGSQAPVPSPPLQTNHFQAQGNPHVWLDPVLAMEICRRIAAALIQVDPDQRLVYEANLKSYLQELLELHQEIEKQVAAFRLRDYVCFHPAFSYFARRYHLREVGVIEASPGREPTPRQIQGIVTAIRRYGVRVVFAEPQFNPRVAEVIAREAGARVLMLDPLGGRPPYGTDYLKLMRYNLAMMQEAMG
jgi:zinc transport system substrate-binding protein